MDCEHSIKNSVVFLNKNFKSLHNKKIKYVYINFYIFNQYYFNNYLGVDGKSRDFLFLHFTIIAIITIMTMMMIMAPKTIAAISPFSNAISSSVKKQKSSIQGFEPGLNNKQK